MQPPPVRRRVQPIDVLFVFFCPCVFSPHTCAAHPRESAARCMESRRVRSAGLWNAVARRSARRRSHKIARVQGTTLVSRNGEGKMRLTRTLQPCTAIKTAGHCVRPRRYVPHNPAALTSSCWRAARLGTMRVDSGENVRQARQPCAIGVAHSSAYAAFRCAHCQACLSPWQDELAVVAVHRRTIRACCCCCARPATHSARRARACSITTTSCTLREQSLTMRQETTCTAHKTMPAR